MLLKRQSKNRLRQKVITKQVQAVILQVDHHHHIAQRAVASLHHPLLAHVAQQVVILAVDHEEGRSEDNNEKIHNKADLRNAINVWGCKRTKGLRCNTHYRK